MRTSYYKIVIQEGRRRDYDNGNERNIHSRGERHPVLDRHINQRVRIIGKPYDIELEGKQLSEIWPGKLSIA